MLQYITDNSSRRAVEDQIKEVLDAGCGWIEIATDGLSDDRIRKIVEGVMPLCIEKEAFLIFRDKVNLAKEINVGGVCLSEGSEFPSHARTALGAAAVVGVEAHDTDRISSLQGLDVDFVMLRPYKAIAGCDTTPLGLAGIADICRFMESKEILLPRVAAGGVTYDDIAPLMDAGCNGVAMSEALADAPDIADATARAIALLKVYEEKEQEKLKK
ncbi:MAG: thiamine phosphate synthase [Muribaculaceae bacterium]|nr:thiamine phosphate synthase [Muribaculaceae bacterium]